MKKQPKKKFVPHKFNKRICHWEYCSQCGLVALRNEPTAVAIRKGCDVE